MDSNNKNDKNLKDFEETKELWDRQVFSYNLIMIRPCQQYFFYTEPAGSCGRIFCRLILWPPRGKSLLESWVTTFLPD